MNLKPLFLLVIICAVFIAAQCTGFVKPERKYLGLDVFEEPPQRAALAQDVLDGDVCGIELPNWALTGTDAACEAAGKYILNYMLEHDCNLLFIENTGYIPTAQNPVTLEFARKLAEGY